MKDYSLCTYTFNDQKLLSGLLDSVKNWSIPPKEIIIIDDHSESMFPVTEIGSIPVIYIYHEKNLGPTKTKQHGIDLASYSYILSCDCDVRLDNNWVEKIYSILASNESLGMCSSPISYECGNDSISRYLKKFCSTTSSGYTNFISGPVWMITKKAWEDVDGWKEFHLPTHEDINICQRLICNGYNLYLNDEVEARHVRRISRIDVVRRHWQWKSGVYRDNYNDINIDNEVNFIVGNSAKRIKDSLLINELIFVYIEILYVAHSILWLLNLYGCNKEYSDFSSALFYILNEHKRLKYKFIGDLKKIGHVIDRHSKHRNDYWDLKLQVLSRLNESGVITWINDYGTQILDKEDRDIQKDFSFHSIAKLDVS